MRAGRRGARGGRGCGHAGRRCGEARKWADKRRPALMVGSAPGEHSGNRQSGGQGAEDDHGGERQPIGPAVVTVVNLVRPVTAPTARQLAPQTPGPHHSDPRRGPGFELPGLFVIAGRPLVWRQLGCGLLDPQR